jgi:hypothetical protein
MTAYRRGDRCRFKFTATRPWESGVVVDVLNPHSERPQIVIASDLGPIVHIPERVGRIEKEARVAGSNQ